jgi:hypothetical protein
MLCAVIWLKADVVGSMGVDVDGFLGLILGGHLHRSLGTSVSLSTCK